MIKEINRITKGTRNLLIVTSIGVLAGLTLLIFNNQERVSTLIEQEQKIESRGLPNVAPIELLGEMSMVSGEDLREYLVSLGVNEEKIKREKLLEWLKAKAKQLDEINYK